MSDCQAGRDLQTAYRATFEWIVFIQDTARHGLIAGQWIGINHFIFLHLEVPRQRFPSFEQINRIVLDSILARPWFFRYENMRF